MDDDRRSDGRKSTESQASVLEKVMESLDALNKGYIRCNNCNPKSTNHITFVPKKHMRR